MDHLDTAREKVADAIAHLEDAISAALPGQAPASKPDDVRRAIRKVRVVVSEALQALNGAESNLLKLGEDDR